MVTDDLTVCDGVDVVVFLVVLFVEAGEDALPIYNRHKQILWFKPRE